MVAIVDYGAGNIKSVENAVRYLGHEAVLTRDPAVILSADHVILPGVGAFGDAMTRLSRYGLDEVLRKAAASGTPFLGICLGLQLLFESSEESPGAEGLGILKGRYFEGTHSSDPGRRGPKSPPDRLERPDLSQSGKAVCGSSGRILCIFCPLILPAGRGSIDRNSVHTVRRAHRRIRGERKRICLPVPPRKERGGRHEDPAEFPDDLIKPAR